MQQALRHWLHLPAHFLTAAWLLAAVLVAARADTAFTTDGQRHKGVLRREDGRLLFRTSEQQSLDWSRIQQVHLAGSRSSPWLTPAGRQLRFRDGQSLSAHVRGIDAEAVEVESPMLPRPMRIPRGHLAALAQVPGWQVRTEGTFHGWKLQGDPEQIAETAVRLGVVGQSAKWTTKSPVRAGRFQVRYQPTSPSPSGARWSLVAEFRNGEQPSVLEVLLAGETAVPTVKVQDWPGESYPLQPPLSDALALQFGPAGTSVALGSQVLWAAEREPPGPLVALSLRCDPVDGTPARGAVRFTEPLLAAMLEPRPHPPGDAEQDELWLADGDQWFGKLTRGSSHTLEIQGAFGRRSVPWTDLRAVYFRAPPTAPLKAPAGAVRVEYDSGLSPVSDELVGGVVELNDKSMSLEHASLGTLRLSRERVRRLLPLRR